MKIYIDSDYKCHVLNDGTMHEFDVPFFDGKCDIFIEGYRCVPPDETWERENGEIFRDEMISPWKDYSELYLAQLEYEVEQYKIAMTEMETALGVNAE